MNFKIKMVAFIVCLIGVASGFLVDDNDHLILIQMKQELDLLKTAVTHLQAELQTTQLNLDQVKSEKQTVQNELYQVKTELGQIQASTSQSQSQNSNQQNIAFMASLAHDVVNPAIGHQIIFDRVHLNKGNGYIGRHGTFLAPVNGIYHFTLEISYLPNPTQSHNTGVYLKKKTENIAYTYSVGTWDNLIRRSTSAIVELVTGDDVYAVVSVIGGGNNTLKGDYHSFYSTFSGFLIQ